MAGIPIYLVIYSSAMCSQGGQIQSLNGCIQDTTVQRPEQFCMAGIPIYLVIYSYAIQSIQRMHTGHHSPEAKQLGMAGIHIYLVIYPYAMYSQGGQIQSLDGSI